MASAVTFSSGNASVYSPETNFKETDPRDLKKLESKLKTIKRQFGHVDLDALFQIKKKKKETE